MTTQDHDERPKIIAVAGGSGSGKTTLVKRLCERLVAEDARTGARSILVLHTDNYYLDLSHLTPAERDQRNFDHPDAFDVPLMTRQMRALLAGQAVDRPTYDFATHTRRPETLRLEPATVILVDGILSLHWSELRALCDLTVFVDVDDDVRFIRRLGRDVTERGRTVDKVVAQYLSTVKPMHDLYVAPQKQAADIIVSWMDYNVRAVDMLAGMIQSWQAGR